MEDASVSPSLPRRSVVSFVRRSTRMTASQASSMSAYASTWVIPVAIGDLATMVAPQPMLDLTAVFGRRGEVIVEVGSGHGDALVGAALARPECDFLGFEVFEPAIASTLGKIASAKVTNVRLISADAVTGLTHLIGDHALSEVWVFFPDPWPKKRHHKRRLIGADFLDLVAGKLSRRGWLRLATDDDSYAVVIAETLAERDDFAVVSTERFPGRALTKYEARGIAHNRKIHDFSCQLRQVQ